MKIAKVMGSCVCTIKESSLTGYKLLVVQDVKFTDNGERISMTGIPYIAVDMVGAGKGEMVCIVSGTSAQSLFSPQKPPIDTAIVGIVDSLNLLYKEDMR